MANTLSEALLVLTSWNTATDDLTSQPTRTLVKDFCEKTLKSDQVSKLYCTVLDVEVSENQKRDAECVGVNLIPATRSKWLNPQEDPPGVNWLVHNGTYYPGLKDLLNIKHVVSFTQTTKNAAAAIHESLFPRAKLHQLSPPESNGVLFTFDIWSKDACGLAGYHRAIIHDFRIRKGRTGQLLKAFSTVLDVKLTEDQKIDAEKCGVTLIPAQQKSKGAKRKDLPNVDWLLKHESHYPELRKLLNIKYVVGYAPKTGWAAAYIRQTLFPSAKLVLINHACPEKNCLLENGDAEDHALEEEMLKMASKADVLFSIGPRIYKYFQNAYRAKIDRRQLSDIPHEEILPKLGQVYFDSKPVIVEGMKGHSLLTYGQLDSLEAVKRCTSMAAAVGTVANKECLEKLPEWKIFGISTQDNNLAQEILDENIKSGKVLTKLKSTSSVPTLLQSIQQSHLCLPPSCYTDYSFEGLEAMAAGLPTTVQDDSHIAAMIERYFGENEDYCIVTGTPENLADKITKNLVDNIKAFKKAKRLKEDLTESEAVTQSLAKFVSIFEGGEAGTQDSDKQVKQPDIPVRATEDTKRTEDVPMPVTGDKECEDSVKAMPAVMSVTQDMEVTKATAMNSGMSVTKDVEITEKPESTTMHPGISVTAYMETTDTTETMAEAEMSITDDMETTNTKAVHGEMSNTEDVEITETTAMNSGMSVTADMETTDTTETTAVPEMSITEDMETTNTKAVHREMSVTDMEMKETTAMNSGMSVTKDVEITETTAMNSGMSVEKDVEITETTAMNPGVSVTKNVEIAETTESTAVQPEMSITEDRETGETTTIHPGISVSETTETTVTAVPEMSMAGNRETRKTTAMHFGISVREDMETTETKEMHHGKARHKKSKTSRNSKQTETLENKETATQTKHRSQRKRKPIHESDKTINPKMAREEKIRGGQCEQSKQDQTEINKTGHIKIKQTKQQTQRTKKISTSERKQQPVDSTTAKDNTYAFTIHVRLDEESYQQQRRDLDSQVQTRRVSKEKELLEAAWRKIKEELEKTETEAVANNASLQGVHQNCRNSFGEGITVTSMKQDSLAISLDLPSLYNLYRLKQTCLSGSFPDSFEPLLITDKMRKEAGKVGLQLKLKATYDQTRFDELELFFINRDGGGLEPVKLCDDFNVAKDAEEIPVHIDEEDTVTDQISDTMVTERVDSSSQTEQGQSLDDIQSKYEMETLKSQLKEAKEEKATLEERCNELTQKLESTQQSLVSQRIGNSVEREKLQSELKENQKLVKELQDKVTEWKGEVGELEYKLELSNLKKAGDKGDWSLTLVNGQHKDQGQKFKGPRGLAFHRDKLVVCDSGNNIVQILNKDYTCDKVIGSFDGQFAKPFRPLSVAISRFNHYFILDGENKQIVVCDANGKIIQIITLPENIKVVWDIALMDDFVLVTLRLTSPDTSVRPEDRGDRLVKYTQSGEYLAEVNGQIRGQGQFDGPVSVVVNSNNVIMVYDGGNGCIKCFDSDLNFLHQFGQSQLSGRIVGYYGCIAVDEDDNVYVCDFNDRIVKYRCDGKLICYLLEGNVRYPLYIAVMGDKIGVVELNSDQIKVFSK